MIRRTVVLAALAACVLATAGLAHAESEEVAGKRFDGHAGDIKKMVADNQQTQIVVKVYGIGTPCEKAHSLNVDVRNSSGNLRYRAEAGCYSGPNGPTWIKGLYYTADGAPESATAVKCDGFKFRWNSTDHFYRVVMPRSCLNPLSNSVKIVAEGDTYQTAWYGHAGPTSLLSRG